jgi:hypothetical protein
MDSFSSDGNQLGVKREKNAALLNARAPFIDNNTESSAFCVVPNKTTPESARMQSSQKKVSLFSRA